MNVEKFLFSIPTQKIKPGHIRTKKLLAACNCDTSKLFTIQVVGTNGKGSTCAFLENILQSHYRVGLFTSPHLVDFKERIRVNQKKINTNCIKKFLLQYEKEIKKIKPSFFEIMTVLSIWFFIKQKVDVAILETGLGGKLDSVTACKNNIVAFTKIGLDHMSILGNTLEKITHEKAGAILSKHQIVFSTQQKQISHNILLNRIKKFNNSFYLSNEKQDFNLKYLMGKHQLENANLAQEIGNYLCVNGFQLINQKIIKEKISKTIWPGRFDIIYHSPTIIFDVAHNNDGIKSFTDAYFDYIKDYNFNKKILICGFEQNKNVFHRLSSLINSFNKIICTETGIKKSMDCKILAKKINHKKVTYNPNINIIFSDLIKTTAKNDLICILGSHYFGPHIKKHFNNSFANYE